MINRRALLCFRRRHLLYLLIFAFLLPSSSHPDLFSLLSLPSSFLPHLSWPPNSSYCSSPAISCDSLRHVVSLNLSSASLSGSIPASSLANLSHLAFLDLSHNPRLTGSFPDPLPPALQLLDLSHCSLGGPLPSSIANASALQELYLNHNRFSSSVPLEIGHLPDLRSLDVSHNQLSGGLPILPGSFPKLEFLFLSENFISGSMPTAMTNCTSLRSLALDWNRLAGPISRDFGNLSSNLQILRLQGNDFTGAIPSGIANCKQLQQVRLEHNSFNGPIPEAISHLFQLRTLSLADNELHGHFPAGIVTCTALSVLSLSRNLLFGELPSSLGNLTSLWALLLNDNAFSGSIPSELGHLQLLHVLDLSNNRLKGSVPHEPGKIIGLSKMSSCQTSMNCPSARQLLIDLSDAYLSCVLSKWKLDASVSGHSNPARNGVDEHIAIEGALCSNDNDSMMLRGRGSCPLPKFSGLCYLNLSFNRLSGPSRREIAIAGIMGLDLSNNLNLYASLRDIRHPRHILTEKAYPGGSSLNVGLLSGVVVFLVLLLLFALLLLCRGSIRRLRYRRVVRPSRMPSLKKFRRERSRVFDPSLESISMSELVTSTDGFDSARVIGDGGFGLVFRATMRDGRHLAVKKLSTDGVQGKREFDAEMETLGSIDHRNLVKLLAYCNLGDERALVYEFLENGSLDTWLHEKEDGPKVLNWKRRLRIATGLARGLSYLHHECDPHVIHRDIKSSNILLDMDFEPKIADFGLARNMSPTASHVSTSAAGTLGYMAPEYASNLKATRPADVYSFGMLMLELGTGVRPNIYIKERNLRTVATWAQKFVEEGQEMELLEPLLRVEAAPEEVTMYFSIACRCISYNPAGRPIMTLVLDSLSKIGSDVTVP